MKLTKRFQHITLTAFAGFALAAFTNSAKAANDIHFGPTASEASASNNDGTWINMWGPAYVANTFDSTNPPPSGDTTGSIYFQGNWTGDTNGMDNYNMVSPGTWWGAVHFDGSQYASVQFDFKYDTNSTITPTSAAHQEICFDTGYARQTITNLSLNKASSPFTDGSWHHLSIPISATMSGVSSADGVSFYQWNPAGTSGTMNFWIANVELIARVVPTPPPTLTVPSKPAQGLNVFATTEGNSFYDRQEAELRQSSGISWVGHATQSNPVTYSFTIKNFPNSANAIAYLFLAPNPAAIDSSPDWNESNCAKIFIQGSLSNATMNFQYKVNEPGNQGMYSGASGVVESGTTNSYTNAPGSWDGVTTPWLESGKLSSVTNNTILGTWSMTFTSDTNGTLTAPDGNTASFVFPSYNVGHFAETTAFNVYLGMQANDANGMNSPVVYANFGFSGTASPFTENFLTDTVLDTNIWNNTMSGGPQGVLVVPGTAAEWITWNLPDTGFGLQTSPLLNSPLSWNDLTGGPIIPLYGHKGQYVSTGELPAGGDAFFRLQKRVFSQLLVLLPGETNAPNTSTGKTGTPDTFSVSTNNLVTATVNAVDSTWHIVPGVIDTIQITTTDGTAIIPLPAPLANGTTNFTVQFGSAGSWTVTATDTTNTNIPPATSSSLTVGP